MDSLMEGINLTFLENISWDNVYFRKPTGCNVSRKVSPAKWGNDQSNAESR
jgi:hypothetical protein